ncbi:MAG: DUF4364 family protein [Oscillospiraceae bacterium]|nr:DUF4364 family protein [Oscillospiraceae bacterium]
MDGFGFIHERLDIELLILYILNRLPGAIDKDTLTELTISCDGGINYFNFSDALGVLVTTGHVSCVDDKYSTTAKGIENGNITETSIPYPARVKAERLLIPIAQKLRRNDMIKTETKPAPNGGYSVHLSLSDGSGSLISMDILAGSESQARQMAKKFHANAEELYAQIAMLLMDET